jgi:para-nitrobenzyl esterase
MRWSATQPHACWPQTLDATSFGSACTQIASTSPLSVTGQEDCLTANVWTPPSATSDSKLPVLVFIHGGGNVQGSSSDKTAAGAYTYGGASLSASQNVVVVTINYRLGAFGYLAHPSLGANPGNYGTLDQIFALGWVQRNAPAERRRRDPHRDAERRDPGRQAQPLSRSFWDRTRTRRHSLSPRRTRAG